MRDAVDAPACLDADLVADAPARAAISAFRRERRDTRTNNGCPPRRAGRARFCVGGSRRLSWARRAAAIRLQGVAAVRCMLGTMVTPGVCYEYQPFGK